MNKLDIELQSHIKIPNEETLKAFEDGNNKIGLTVSKNTKEMFDKLGI